jgi:hypothetical protein
VKTITLTPAQAQHVAALIQQAQTAKQSADDAVTLLTLGLVPAGAALTDVNTDTGVCTFTVPAEASDGL